MSTRTSYEDGTPSWCDLTTTDPAAAKAFYGTLFGWEFEDYPTDDGGVYTMCKLKGLNAAGLFEQPEEMKGMPSFWNHYITTRDLEGTIAKVGSAGGTVVAEPFDIEDSGRMAVIADVTGANTCLWSPKDQIGAEIVNEHGAFFWSELYVPDPEAAFPFYAEVFGWKRTPMETPDDPYLMFSRTGEMETAFAATMKPPGEGVPPHWAVWFAVDDVDAAVATAVEAGGSVPVKPFEIMPGQAAMIQDPTGASFFVLQMNEPSMVD